MKKFLLIILLLLIAFFGYSFGIAPKIITINEYSLSSELIPRGFDGSKIIHFSDLKYANDSPKILDKLVDIINEQNPDLVFFTGDLIDGKLTTKNKTALLNSLKKIQSKLGKFAILGDKDNQTSQEILETTGFMILNEEIKIFNNDVTPIIISNYCSYEEPPETYTICLIHKPDDIDKMTNYISSLVLAGHGLGGQIQLPFWGALIKESGAKKYSNRYYEIGDTQLFVSNGIGNGSLNVRIFNEPSINLYRLNND